MGRGGSWWWRVAALSVILLVSAHAGHSSGRLAGKEPTGSLDFVLTEFSARSPCMISHLACVENLRQRMFVGACHARGYIDVCSR